MQENRTGLIDLHLHAVPGIDDGVKDVRQSLEMLEGLSKLGFSHLVTTPHRDFSRWAYSESECETAYREVLAALEENNIDLELGLGAEYTYGEQFQDEVSSGEAKTLGATNCLLLELPEKQMPDTVLTALFQTRLKGYEVILAHPERCRVFHGKPEKLAQLASGRALVQVSFRSLAGTFGRTIKKTAWALIEDEIADLVATDCHSPREIKKIVVPVLKALRERLPAYRFREIMTDFPARLLNL